MWEKVKTMAREGMEVISNAPIGGIIKGAILIGVTGFTFWVMVTRVKEMVEEAREDHSEKRAPVDDILGVNYTVNPDDFADMDPEAQRICRKLNKTVKHYGTRFGRKKSSGKKKSNKPSGAKKPEEKAKVVSVFDDGPVVEEDEEIHEPRFYKDAQEMLLKNRKTVRKNVQKGKRNARKAAQVKGKPKISQKGMMDLKKICDEWYQSGCANTDSFRKRVDAIAKEFGLRVDELEDAITDKVRKQAPSLF